MKSPLKRANEIAHFQLWPKVYPYIKVDSNTHHLNKVKQFIAQYSQVIAWEEAGDARITMQLRLSWDGTWQKHLDRLRDAG